MTNKKIIVPAVILAIGIAFVVLVNLLSNRKPSEESLQFFPVFRKRRLAQYFLKTRRTWLSFSAKAMCGS